MCVHPAFGTGLADLCGEKVKRGPMIRDGRLPGSLLGGPSADTVERLAEGVYGRLGGAAAAQGDVCAYLPSIRS